MQAGVKLKVNGIGMGVFAVCSSGLAVSLMCKDNYATEEGTPPPPHMDCAICNCSYDVMRSRIWCETVVFRQRIDV